MTQGEANNLPTGIYVLNWKVGGRSLAAVYRDSFGFSKFCPINWTSGPSSSWDIIDSVVTVLTQVDLDYAGVD